MVRLISILIQLLPNNKVKGPGNRIFQKQIIFFSKTMQKMNKKNSSRPLFIFKKALYEVKTSSLWLSFNIFR